VKTALGTLTVSLALALAVTACTKNSTTTTAPTTVTRTTDTFTGTVPVKSSDAHSFPVAQTGQVDATLTAAGPPTTIMMGFAIGTLDASSTCVPFAGGSTNVAAGTAAQLSGIFSPGTLCVQVRDVGNQTAPVTYTVIVTHP